MSLGLVAPGSVPRAGIHPPANARDERVRRKILRAARVSQRALCPYRSGAGTG